jgi:hypothetical protein
VPSAAATVEVSVLWRYEPSPGVVGDRYGDDVDEDGGDECVDAAVDGGERSGMRDVTVTLDAVESNVCVLCDGAPYAKPSCSTCSRSGKLFETAIGPGGDVGVGGGGASTLCRSIRRSTRSEALRIETDGSTGRMKREVNKRSDGPIGEVGVDKL